MNQECLKNLSVKFILDNYAGLIVSIFADAKEIASSKDETDLSEAVCIVRSVLFNNDSEEEAQEKVGYFMDQVIPEMCKKNNIPDNHVGFISNLAISVLLEKDEINQLEKQTNKKVLRLFDFQK